MNLQTIRISDFSIFAPAVKIFHKAAVELTRNEMKQQQEDQMKKQLMYRMDRLHRREPT
jgi:hypothetical protein